MNPDLVLASASPRRAAMMEAAGYRFRVAATHVDESIDAGTPAERAAVQLAERKARASASPGWVVAADTLLDLDGTILGKPRDDADARRILRALSGRAHRVLTGVSVRAPDGALRSACAVTRVTFAPLTESQIDAYVATGEPAQKAGAYAIQGKARAFIVGIDGPEDNVIGLPMDLVARLLRESGYRGA